MTEVYGFPILPLSDGELFVVQRALEEYAELQRIESRKSCWHGNSFKAYRDSLRDRAVEYDVLAARVSLHREEIKNDRQRND